MQRLQDDTTLIVLKYIIYKYINAYELSQNFPRLGMKLKLSFSITLTNHFTTGNITTIINDAVKRQFNILFQN